MSEEVIATEESNEKESVRVLVLDEVNTTDVGDKDVKNDDTNEVSDKTKTPKFVEQKQVGELIEDERSLIIANARNGVDQPYFNVKFFKNGKVQITKKRKQTPTVSQKAIKNTPPSNTEKKVYYSDNQLLFEHIIELNSKVDKLMAKHKKLKRRYQTLQNDIYVDEDDIKNDVVAVDNNKELNTTKQNDTEQEQEHVTFDKSIRRNWRFQVKYI